MAWCLVLVISLLFTLPAMAEETIESITFENKWPEFTPGTLASDQAGTTLYFAMGDALVVLDSVTLEERSRIYVETKKGITGIVYDETADMVYASCGSGGLKIIDVTDPLSPRLMNKTILKNHRLDEIYGSALDVKNNVAYLADLFYGLHIIDVSDPSNPNLLGYFEEFSEYTNEETGETFSGGHINVKVATINNTEYAFVLDRYYGLRIFDVTQPANPRFIERFDMRTDQYWGQVSLVVDIAVDSKYAYITDTTYGLTVLSLFSDPDNPKTIKLEKAGQIETPGSASGIFLDGHQVYVADGMEGLFVVEALDRTNLLHGGTHEASGVYGVHLAGDLIFMASLRSGLVSLAKTGSFAYAQTAVYDPPCGADAVFVEEDHAYILDNDGPKGRMTIVDLSPNGEYHLTGYITTPGEASAILVLEDRAYVADGSAGVSVFDVSKKSAPDFLGNDGIKNPGVNDVSDITLFMIKGDQGGDDENLFYYTDRLQGLFMAGLDDQGKMQHQGHFGLDQARAVAIYQPRGSDKRYALVVNGSGLFAIDVTDPASPNKIFYFDTPGDALDIGVKDDYAVVSDGSKGVQLVDLSDLAQPRIVATYATEGRAEALFVHDFYIHTATGSGGLQILGIVDNQPPELTLIAGYATPGYVAAACVAGNDDKRLTYVGDGHGGLVSFLHKDSLYSGIDEKPFTESTDDTGWGKLCFISTLF
jgi:hypothetical protein